MLQRIQRRRGLDDAREKRDLAEVELVPVLAEPVLCRILGAVRPASEIDRVGIAFENFLLARHALGLDRRNHVGELAGNTAVGAGDDVLGKLLRQCRTSDTRRGPGGCAAHEIDACPRDARRIETHVPGERTVFGRLQRPKEKRWKIAVGGLGRFLADGSGQFSVPVGDSHHAAVRRTVEVERRPGIQGTKRPGKDRGAECHERSCHGENVGHRARRTPQERQKFGGQSKVDPLYNA